MTMVPHKALYDITLRSAKTSSGIADVHGQMFYSLQETCDSWVSTHRFIITYDYIDNPSARTVSEYTTTESKDWKSMKFVAHRNNDVGETEEVAGSVARPAQPGKKFLARFTAPDRKNMPLDDGTMFPVQHTFKVINNALDGKKFIKGEVFDGSDMDGPYAVSGLVLKPISIPERKRIWPNDVDKDLASVHGWRTQVAIFPLNDKGASASDYEMDMNLLENGVVTDMSVRYSDFTIEQELKALSKLPSPACPAPGAAASPAAAMVPEAMPASPDAATTEVTP